MKKRITKLEREHLLAVKGLPCVICNHPPISEAHHICDTGRRLGHSFVLPLCANCHRGDNGFSGKNRSAWDKSLKNQLELCKQVYKLLGREWKQPFSKLRQYDN
jgi:hypothetical protein